MSDLDEYDPARRQEIQEMADGMYEAVQGHDINLALNAIAHLLADICGRSVEKSLRDEALDRCMDYVRALVPEYVAAKHANQN